MANEFNKPLPIPLSSLQTWSAFRQTLPAEQADRKLRDSVLGTPIYSSLIFKALSANESAPLGTDVKKIVSNDLELVHVMITVDQTKNIVKTPLNGRPGTVKEYISKGDYMIKVDGLIVSDLPLVYPAEQVKDLSTFLDLQQSLQVASSVLSTHAITRVVVSDYKFFPVEGSRNVVEFSCNMLSDTDFKIQPTDNNDSFSFETNINDFNVA